MIPSVYTSNSQRPVKKTLKYPCFPAIAGNVESWDSAVNLVEEWMHYSNHVRSHRGPSSQGLPPVPFALVMQRKAPRMQFDPDLRELGSASLASPPPPQEGESRSRLVLAK